MRTSVSTFPSGVLCKEDNAMPKSTRKCLAAAATSVGRQGHECYRQRVPLSALKARQPGRHTGYSLHQPRPRQQSAECVERQERPKPPEYYCLEYSQYCASSQHVVHSLRDEGTFRLMGNTLPDWLRVIGNLLSMNRTLAASPLSTNRPATPCW